MKLEPITPEQFKAHILACLRTIASESTKSEESTLLECDERFLYGDASFMVKYSYAPRDADDPEYSFYIDLSAEEDQFVDVCLCLFVDKDNTVSLTIVNVCDRQDEFFSFAEFMRNIETIKTFVQAVVDFFKKEEHLNKFTYEPA